MGKAVTTQATAKKWKLLQAIGVLGVCVGVPFWFAPSLARNGALVSAGGAVFYLVGRAGAWWNHG